MAYQKAPMLKIYDFVDELVRNEGTSAYSHLAHLEFAGFVELYSSLLWDIEHYTVGSFEVYLPATPEYLELLQIDRIVGREDDTENYGVIESVLVEHDSEEGDYMTVSGRFLPCLLERRVILPTAYSSDSDYGTYHNFATYVLEGSYNHSWSRAGGFGRVAAGTYNHSTGATTLAYSSDDHIRMIPGLLVSDYDYPDTLSGIDYWLLKIGRVGTSNTSGTMQVTGDNMMEWLYTICKTVDGAIRIDASNLFTSSGGYMVLYLTCIGKDLRNKVIFSDEYNNLSAVSYSYNTTSMANFVYALGSGEGSQRAHSSTYSSDGNNPSGIARHEAYYSATNGDETGDTDTSTTTSDLESDAISQLTDATHAAEATIAPDVQYTYGVDYNVGDIVTVKYNTLGISLDARLTGMIESFDHTGRTLTPTFSFDI